MTPKEQESQLYAYVFDDDVSASFRNYSDASRKGWFRQKYVGGVQREFESTFPWVVRAAGAPSERLIVERRVRRSSGTSWEDRRDHYIPLAKAWAEHAAKPLVIHELVEVESVWRELERMSLACPAELVDLARKIDAGTASSMAGLGVVDVRTSVRESLVRPRRGVDLLRWTVRLPQASRLVLHRHPHSGRVTAWYATPEIPLAEQVARRFGG